MTSEKLDKRPGNAMCETDTRSKKDFAANVASTKVFMGAQTRGRFSKFYTRIDADRVGVTDAGELKSPDEAELHAFSDAARLPERSFKLGEMRTWH